MQRQGDDQEVGHTRVQRIVRINQAQRVVREGTRVCREGQQLVLVGRREAELLAALQDELPEVGTCPARHHGSTIDRSKRSTAQAFDIRRAVVRDERRIRQRVVLAEGRHEGMRVCARDLEAKHLARQHVARAIEATHAAVS